MPWKLHSNIFTAISLLILHHSAIWSIIHRIEEVLITLVQFFIQNWSCVHTHVAPWTLIWPTITIMTNILHTKPFPTILAIAFLFNLRASFWTLNQVFTWDGSSWTFRHTTSSTWDWALSVTFRLNRVSWASFRTSKDILARSWLPWAQIFRSFQFILTCLLIFETVCLFVANNLILWTSSRSIRTWWLGWSWVCFGSGWMNVQGEHASSYRLLDCEAFIASWTISSWAKSIMTNTFYNIHSFTAIIGLIVELLLYRLLVDVMHGQIIE